MSWSWTIIKQMSEMRSAARAFYFITCHPMTGIRGYGYFLSFDRRIETGPTGAGLKFRVPNKQLVPARASDIKSFFVVVPILILVWRLGFGFAKDLKLSGSQGLSPLVITQCPLLRHRSGLDLVPDSRGVCVFRLADTNR